MSEAAANRYFRVAVLYGVIGMAWGIHMAISGNHATYPAHAHLLLLGWVSMALYGVVFRLCPRAGEGALARFHIWIANGGLLIMTPGVAMIHSGNAAGDPLAGIGAILTILAMLIFAYRVWRGTAAAA